jgi:hypothetical protein
MCGYAKKIHPQKGHCQTQTIHSPAQSLTGQPLHNRVVDFARSPTRLSLSGSPMLTTLHHHQRLSKLPQQILKMKVAASLQTLQ